MIAGIDHVQLAAPPGSEEEARRFFGGLLGLEELPKPEPLAKYGGAWFACGGQQLHVGIDPEFTPAARAHPAFAVDGAERLAKHGGAWFACGGQQLHVGIDPEFTPAARAHPAFAVDGAERLAAVAARLGGAGVEVTWDQEMPGSERFYASDPWGNRLEFTAT